jgi:hypothetical protein
MTPPRCPRKYEFSRSSRTFLIIMLLLIAFAGYGCGHKLVATNGSGTVSVYPDKAAFDRLRSLQSQGGALGMLGGIVSDVVVRKVDVNTPVKILSSDSEGDFIQVMAGPDIGIKGYVAKVNVE